MKFAVLGSSQFLVHHFSVEIDNWRWEEKINKLEIQMKEDAETTAINNGLFDEARENAEKVQTSFVDNFDAYDRYDIIFTDEK